MIDVPLQLLQFKRALRMTRQELRDEAKDRTAVRRRSSAFAKCSSSRRAVA